MKIMKVNIKTCYFAEIDGVTFVSTIEDDLDAAVSHIEDLEYQIVDTGYDCEINFIIYGDVEPVEKAVNEFINQRELQNFTYEFEVYDLDEEGGEDV